MENHDIPVAEAQDLREKASLIGVHCELEVLVKDHDVPFANVRGGISGNGCDVGIPLLLLGGSFFLVEGTPWRCSRMWPFRVSSDLGKLRATFLMLIKGQEL